MRYRRVKGAKEKFERLSQFIVSQPMEKRGAWNTVFGNDHPIFLEMGCGKGKFLIQQAQNHPEHNYIGIEGQERVLLRSAQNALESGLPNVLFLCEFVKELDDYFAPEEISGLFLNFSDPWPKARHAKRRLTHRRFLEAYRRILKPDGEIQFKTDNDALFDFSVEAFQESGFSILELSYDLHGSGLKAKEVTTDYEEKFKRWGKKIKYLRAAL